MTEQAKRGTSGHGNVEKYSAGRGHTTTGPQYDFSQTMDFKRWSRTILKDVVGERLTHDCPCSRQTGKRFRSSYTSEKNGPQTQPTNKQAIEFDLQPASQSGHQNEPRPITSTYIKTLVLPANDLYEDPALVTCSESVPILHPPVGQQKRLRLPTFSQQRKPAAARIANKQVCKQLEIANIFRLGPGSYPDVCTHYHTFIPCSRYAFVDNRI